MALNFLNDAYFAGKVGIGTDSPSRGILVVKGDFETVSSGNAQLAVISGVLGSNPSAADVGGQMVFGGPISSSDSNRTFGLVGGYKENNTSGDRAGYLSFGTRQNTGSRDIFERMRITSDGNVGIGTINPGAKLDVATTTYSNSFVDIQNLKYTTFNVLKFGYTGSTGSIRTGTIDSGIFGFAVNTGDGTERMRIDSSGNVGIGTTSPSEMLTVGDGSSHSTINIDKGVSSDGTLLFNKGGTSSAHIKHTIYEDLNIASGAGALQFQTGTSNSTRMVIQALGNVGIGTTSPSGILSVSDGTYDTLRVNNGTSHLAGTRLYRLDSEVGSSTAWMLDATGNSIIVGPRTGTVQFTVVDASENVKFIVDDGNVGIGTTSPGSKLEVVGNITLRQSLTNTETNYISTNARGGGSSDADMRLGNSVNGDVLTIHNDKVGIRTSSPSTQLHVVGTGLFTGLVSGITPVAAANFVTKAYVDGSGGGTGPFLPLAGGTMTGDLNIHEASTPTLSIKDTTNNVNLLLYSQDANSHVGTYSSHPLIFDTNSSERMRITSDGKVGIGTSFPLFKLQTNAAITGGWLGYLNGTSATFGTNNFSAVHSSTAIGTGTESGINLANNASDNGAPSPIISFSAKSASASYQHAYAAIYGIKTATGADTNWNKGDLVFATGQSTGPFERMRIEADGKIQVGSDKVIWAGGYGGALVIRKNNATSDRLIKMVTVNSTGAIANDNVLVARGANVGIGTSNPAAKLTVQGADNLNAFKITDSGDGDGFKVTSHTTQGTYVQIYNAAHTQTIKLDGRSDSTARHTYFNGGGNVGIGNTAPGYELDVTGSVQSYISATRYIRLQGASADFEVVSDNNTKPVSRITGTGTADLFQIFDNTTEVFTVLDGGNVGIGTTSPQQKLHIKSTTSGPTGIIIENTNNGQSLDLEYLNNTGAAQARIRYNEGAGSFDFSPNVGVGAAMTILYGGNVGIGLTSPQSKLQVAGGIQMADDTATASADKVGTMRYRTGTEYVEVTGTELIYQPLNLLANWLSIGSTTTITADTFTTVSTAGGVRRSSFLTVGQVYRAVISGTTTSTSNQINNFSNNSNYKSWSGAGAFNFTFTFTATTDGGMYLRLWPGTAEIYSLSVIEVTAEDASYADMCMQTGASTYEWVNIVRNTY